ncbi:MAG: threonine ammonia-lyase, biosynthetic [Gammaproteobacteria bacterium]|uniref:L-threonine dehydratase n=1 Tax=SAR86 cluster bacterium TaxID=2030880 RepID=A0A368C669_9GAMM|nr:MAG: threonine ammonia-lyase, biosynthetic [SAR86 cluster bacterium]RPG41462.1 MAG: threonine ammonia-lyase, biosynthetic [Gammaproteobacteria bacterium TMED186]
MRLKINKTGSFKFSKKYLKLISDAGVYDVAIKTPITFATNMSAKVNNEVFLKREDLQPVFSFKNRGAYNKIISLTPSQKKKGVIAASAGNHAQGVAFACNKLKIPCLIVMPITTPDIKIRSVKNFGAKIILEGDSFNQAVKAALKIAKTKSIEFIHPFDDQYTIAGQGTIGKEILEYDENYDAIFLPVGGGGLLAGVSAWIAQNNKRTKIYGVEVEDSACLLEAIKFDKRVRLREVGLFADGVAVEQVGKNNFDVIKECVDGVITVSVDEVCAAVKDIFEDTRVLSEPAGALALAGLKKYSKKIKNKRLLAVSSGANVNFERLSYIVERSELGENREKILSIQIPEKPGSFLRLCRIFGKAQITEFNYRMSDDIKAFVLVGIKTKTEESFKTLKDKLKKSKFKFNDLTKNEISNDHLRHMVGGRNNSNSNNSSERIFRSEFPQKPDALINFLRDFGINWNISLFHYRNLGAAFAKVLIGIQDNNKSSKKLEAHLKSSEYNFVEETSNNAYQDFLR